MFFVVRGTLMCMSPAIARALTASLVLMFAASPAEAQSRPYIGGTAFGDVRLFGDNAIVPYAGDDFSLDATGVGGGLRVGTFLHPRWSVELAVDAASRTSVEVENPFRILIFPPPPSFDLEASTSFFTVTTMVGFHPPSGGRLRLAYRAGFGFVRGTYRSDSPGYILAGSTVTWSSTQSNVRNELIPIGLRPIPLPSPTFTRTSTTQTQNAGALTLGFDAGIDITSRFALVPEMRALVFSAPLSGPTVFLIRPGLGVRWTF